MNVTSDRDNELAISSIAKTSNGTEKKEKLIFLNSIHKKNILFISEQIIKKLLSIENVLII